MPLANVVAAATGMPVADLEKSFANIIKRQSALEDDRLGNTSATIEALRAALLGLDRDARRRIVSAVVELAVANPKANVLVKTFTWNGARDGLEVCRDVVAALVLFDAGLAPLDWLEKGDAATLAKLKPRAIARRKELGDAWRLELEVLGMGSGAAELALVEKLFTLLALSCGTDEEGIRLAVDESGPGSQGYEALTGCAAWLRRRHDLAAPRVLDPSRGWDGGAKEKAQGIYELLVAAHHVAPALVPELAVKLFAQMWAPKRTPGLWLAFAEVLEDHVPKGEGRYLSATARAGDVVLKYSRSKVTIVPAKPTKKKPAKRR
jgi:hypothetical protein